jgi:RNA polymerase sigma-70 factor (ECF subfamily)
MVRAEFPYVWRALRRFGLSAVDADDAAQQVFLVAVRRFTDIRPGSARAFLYGIAANVAWKVRRGAARRPEDGAEMDEYADRRSTAEDLLDQRRARELLDRVLDGLEHDVRVVFVLHEIEGLTTAEIANALDIPPGTAASRLRRGREAFTSRLQRLRSQTGERP